MHGVPPPDVHALLPPILACLPTAFLSARPPPALLPLLSPILRQKVHLLSQQDSSSRQHDLHASGNWLSLLTWQAELKPRLVHIVSSLQLEAHPVSGELDLFGDDMSPDAGKAEYQRLDTETLQAKCEVKQYGLVVVWLWCTADSGTVGLEALNAAFLPQANGHSTEAKASDGWRVTEVLPVEDDTGAAPASLAEGWSHSITEAEQAFSTWKSAHVTHVIPDSNSGPEDAEEEDNDDYWNMYDRTPGPASVKPSPKPHTPGAPNGYFAASSGSTSELDYYARYGSVQPAMDPHDPDEAEAVEGLESTVGIEQQEKDAWIRQVADRTTPRADEGKEKTASEGRVNPDAPTNGLEQQREGEAKIHSPSPTRPNSAEGERPVDYLQRKASTSTAVELGIKQHISHELKSLFRLCQSVGIERSEFERMVQLELATLGQIEL